MICVHMCICRRIIKRIKFDVSIQSSIKRVVYDLGLYDMNSFRHDMILIRHKSKLVRIGRPVTWKNRRRGLGEPLLA